MPELLMMFLIFVAATAKPVPLVPVTASNSLRLQPVAAIDFTEEFQNGWFVLSDNAQQAAVLDRQGNVWQVTPQGQFTMLIDVNTDDTFVTGLYHDRSFLGVISSIAGIKVMTLQADVVSTMQLEDITDYPAEMWADEHSYFVETVPVTFDGEAQVWIIDRLTGAARSMGYAPAQDETAVVRIGRIPAPYTVTSSEQGAVTLWDWTTGEALQTVSNGVDIPAVFGNINHGATHLVWRDNASETLYLLDFATGINTVLASLNGEYAQWFFLSNDASLIIGVNVGFMPNVVVWNAATGERTDLGNHRVCGRPQPDMARLSADGTTLVIGCATGLEFWQIQGG